MDTFDFAVARVLKNEGGLSENPKDLGGITHYGISLRFLKLVPIKNLFHYEIVKNEVNEETIRNLTVEQAKEIYRREFWYQANFYKIKDLDVCSYLFDAVVHHGMAPGIKMIQRACWSIFADRAVIKEDGILGTDTIDCINRAAFFILAPFRSERAGYCRSIVAHNPAQSDKLEGWLNRCYGG